SSRLPCSAHGSACASSSGSRIGSSSSPSTRCSSCPASVSSSERGERASPQRSGLGWVDTSQHRSTQVNTGQHKKRRRKMEWSLSRRTFVASAMATVAAPALLTRAAKTEEPLLLRCSLETAPSHTRNAVVRDYLGRIESAAGGRIKTQLFENGQLFPDLQVGKA